MLVLSKIYLFCGFLTLFWGSAFAFTFNSNDIFGHEVKDGETLEEILVNYGASYKNREKVLKQTLMINPGLIETSGKNLKAGSWVRISKKILNQSYTHSMPDKTLQPTQTLPKALILPKEVQPAPVTTISPAQKNIKLRKIAGEKKVVRRAIPKKITEYALFSFSPKISNTRIDSVDKINGGRSTFLSQINYGMDLKWSAHFSADYRMGISAGIEQQQYSVSQTSKTLDQGDVVLASFHLDGQMSLSDFNGLGFKLGVHQEPFARGRRVNVNSLYIIPITQFQLFFDQKFHQGAKLGTGMKLFGAYEFSSGNDSMSIDSGKSFGGEFWLNHSKEYENFRTGIVYERIEQDTSVSEQSITKLGVFLTLFYETWGDE